MSLIAELRRRNVFRVGLLYLVASWLILQVADILVPALALPDWVIRLITLLLILLLPLVLIFSWVYEITPEGIRLEGRADRSPSITDAPGRKIDVVITVLLLLAIGTVVVDRMIPERAVDDPLAGGEQPADPPQATPETVPTAVPEQSIAVLPFVNMSPDEENAYFADGVSEELLNLLARVPPLRVAARTSSFSFRGEDLDVPTVASRLGVANILEGSVRKVGDQVRITAQLVKADGFHIWSDTWDRTLGDVFGVQDEIAEAVVAELTPRLVATAPTAQQADPDAYLLYLQAKRPNNRANPEDLVLARELLERTVEIDPDFADAWRELARTYSNSVGRVVSREEGYPLARAANERALALDPNNPKALAGLAWIAKEEWDFDSAKEYLRRARAHGPFDTSVLNTGAAIANDEGRMEEAIALYRQGLDVDPLATTIRMNLMFAYLNSGRWEEALTTLDEVEALEPGRYQLSWARGWIELLGRGNPQLALELFTATPNERLQLWGLAATYHALGQTAESDATIERLRALSESGIAYPIAYVYALRGELESAFTWLNRAVVAREPILTEVRSHYGWRPYHDDPRWTAVLDRMGFAPS